MTSKCAETRASAASIFYKSIRVRRALASPWACSGRWVIVTTIQIVAVARKTTRSRSLRGSANIYCAGNRRRTREVQDQRCVAFCSECSANTHFQVTERKHTERRHAISRLIDVFEGEVGPVRIRSVGIPGGEKDVVSILEVNTPVVRVEE